MKRPALLIKQAAISLAIALCVLLAISAGAAQEKKSGQGRDSSDNWLRVEVTNAEGQPLSRACVTVVPREGEVLFRQADKRGTTRFKKLAPGKYRVVVKVDGYTAQKREVTVNSGEERVAFTLQPREANAN